ncbi:MAG: DUF1641 domain-containing protein [Acidilobus sp.]
MTSEAERQAEALQRLMDLLSTLNELLSDEELLRTASKLIMTPELFMLLERLPQIIPLLERLTRPETLKLLESLLEVLSKMNVQALASALEALAKPPTTAPTLSQLLAQLGDPAVLRGLSAMLALAKALGGSS